MLWVEKGLGVRHEEGILTALSRSRVVNREEKVRKYNSCGGIADGGREVALLCFIGCLDGRE